MKPIYNEVYGDPNIEIIVPEASAPEETNISAPILAPPEEITTAPQEIVNNVPEDIPAPLVTAPVYESCINFMIPVKTFKDIISVYKSITNELKVKFTSNGIFISCVDPAHVCMISEEIPARSFEEYKIWGAEEIVLGIDLEKLLTRLKGADKNDMLTFSYSTVDETNIKLKIGSFDYTINTLDTAGMPDSKIPVLMLPSVFDIPVKTFYTFLSQAQEISDYMEIKTSRDGLFLSAAGDVDKINLNLDRVLLPYLQTDKAYTSKFSVDYLINVFKSLKTIFKENVRFEIGDDNPLRLTGSGDVNITVLLAPRISEEDQ